MLGYFGRVMILMTHDHDENGKKKNGKNGNGSNGNGSNGNGGSSGPSNGSKWKWICWGGNGGGGE